MDRQAEIEKAQARAARRRQRFLREQNERYQRGVFEPIPPEEWPAVPHPTIPLVGLFRSRDFLVQQYQEAEGIVRLSVLRTMVDGAGEFQDGISWDELQAVKDGCGFADRDAVEVYPAAVDVVNVANMRHLWVLPEWERVSFAWRSGDE